MTGQATSTVLPLPMDGSICPLIFLQITAVVMAKERGALEYDLFGVAPKGEEHHPLSGLSRFKHGFGGERLDRMGCWDYPLKRDRAELFSLEERRMPSYHL